MRGIYAYSPYGEAQTLGPDEGNPLQYTGRENDGTGLYYYRARYYDPALKRFVSEDPIGIAGGLNLAAYVRGNPITYSDPDGLFRMYGNWGGRNYSAGQSGSSIPVTETKPNSPGSPVDLLDSCFKQHDYCFSSIENGCLTPADQAAAYRKCNEELAQCIDRLPDNTKGLCAYNPLVCKAARGVARWYFAP